MIVSSHLSRVRATDASALLGVALAMACMLGASAVDAAHASQTEDKREVTEASGDELSLADVKRMTAAGLDDEVIVAQIQASGAVWNLTVDEILQLKREGVSDRVLAAVVRTGVIQKHYGGPSKSGRGEDAYEREPGDRHAVAGDVVVEPHTTDVYHPGYTAGYHPSWCYYRPRFGYRYTWSVPWYGTYVYPWHTPYHHYKPHHYKPHHYKPHHYSPHHSGHGGHQGANGNHHGGHKPVIGTRGGRR